MKICIPLKEVMEEMAQYVPDNHGIEGKVTVRFDEKAKEFVVEEVPKK